MRNLLRLFVKYSHVFLFLALEVVAFALLVSNNNYHEASFINASSGAIGSFYEWRTNVTDYLHLSEDNEALAAENARLRNEHSDAFIQRVRDNSTTVNDTIFIQKYEYQQARVVNNSTHLLQNNITIDKGALDGIAIDMGVIGPDGIVGFVTHVSDNFSIVASVLNTQKFNAPARTKRSNNSGVIIWQGYDPTEITMKDVPRYAELAVGDTIVTSSASGRFPENIPVGVILEVNAVPGNDYQTARVRPLTDFDRLSHVYVINNLLRKEQLQLEADAAN